MNVEVPIKLMLNLFDTYVQSILNYGCEIWGFIKADNIEIVHINFCKRKLRRITYLCTPNWEDSNYISSVTLQLSNIG